MPSVEVVFQLLHASMIGSCRRLGRSKSGLTWLTSHAAFRCSLTGWPLPYRLCQGEPRSQAHSRLSTTPITTAQYHAGLNSVASDAIEPHNIQHNRSILAVALDVPEHGLSATYIPQHGRYDQ